MAWTYVVVALVLLSIELLYFRLARKCNILDKPNTRSSHTNPTIRGGGVIFFVASLIWFIYHDFQWPWLMLGITLVAVISFLDDLKPRPATLRFVMHFTAVAVIFYQVPLFAWPWWLLVLALIVSIGALSAFNFMDGINGITGMYALVTLLTFAYINSSLINFTDHELIYFMVLSVLIFLFYNFRRKAVCFAGDVGSISLALVQIFFLVQLIHRSNNFYWVLIFLVFGLDSVITIIYRVTRRENIFKAHRTHLYQYLSNELGVSHLLVSFLYGAVQLTINGILIANLTSGFYPAIFILIPTIVLLYFVIRIAVLTRIAKTQHT